MQHTEREEIEMLVPFYVTGRITADDARRVDEYLRRNPDFAEHVELAREERAATVAVNEALGFPNARASDRIFAEIAREPEPLASRAGRQGRGLLAGLREFFAAPSPGAVRYAAIAAAAVVLVQAAVLGGLLMRPGDAGPGGGYEVAGGPKEAAGTLALVAFQDGATLADMTRVLTEAGAGIVEGPLQGGFYKVRFSAGKGDAAQRIEALKAKSAAVRMVLPSR